jgi:hypothetical protein
VSTFEAESNTHQPVPQQPLWTVALTVASAALWLLGGGFVIWAAMGRIPNPIGSAVLLLAATASVAAVTLQIDWRRQLRETAAFERADASRTEMDARQEVRHQAVMAKAEQVAGEAVEATLDAINQARWKGFAEGMKENLPEAVNGAEVVPLQIRRNGQARPS